MLGLCNPPPCYLAAKTWHSIDYCVELEFISKMFNRTCCPRTIYRLFSFFLPKTKRVQCIFIQTALSVSVCVSVSLSVGECWWDYSVWRVLKAIYRCNYKLERLFLPCWENEDSMEERTEGRGVHESQQASSAVVQLCTSRGIIPRLPALAYTPVSLFELIHPLLLLPCSESLLRLFGTEYQFNLGVTFALYAARMKWPCTYI